MSGVSSNLRMTATHEQIDQSTPQTSLAPRLAPTWLERLEERTLPHFNQLVIWLLLGTAAILASLSFPPADGPRSDAVVSLLSWLPPGVLASPATAMLFRGLLAIGIVLWLLQRWLPWSCWLVVVGFTGYWSLHVETTHNTAHIFNVANMLLIIQAIWITADAPLIRQRLVNGTYWRLPLVPRWVSLASIAYIGMFHTACGLSKLFYSGPQWASGTSLQLWTHLWGRSWSPTTHMILGSRTFTRGLQALTLLLETAGVLAIVPKLRPWIGVGLVAFYLGVLFTFDYGFQFNALLTAIYLLPFERWITSAAIRRLCRP
jgi:hypothetical protein